MGTVSIAHDDSNLKSIVVLKAKKGAKKSDRNPKSGVFPQASKEKETSEKGGTETKYVYGYVIVALGIFYDFFVSHGGVFPWQEGGVW
jgi:hypothetical protein